MHTNTLHLTAAANKKIAAVIALLKKQKLEGHHSYTAEQIDLQSAAALLEILQDNAGATGYSDMLAAVAAEELAA